MPRTSTLRSSFTFDHASVVCCVKFSTDGKLLATGCNKTTQIFNVETGVKELELEEDSKREGDLYVRCLSFSADNKYLASGSEDRVIRVQ